METHFARRARALPVAGDVWSLIIGSLLGDGTLLATTAGWCFRVHHGKAQRRLVEWKHSVLAPFVRTPPRECCNGYYFRTITHTAFAHLRAHFYDAERKVVPLDLVHAQLDALALAVWIMDDGAKDGNQLRINTQSFAFREVEGLAGILWDKFHLEMRINIDKGQPRLRCRASSMKMLRSLVAPLTIPDMLYKLSL